MSTQEALDRLAVAAQSAFAEVRVKTADLAQVMEYVEHLKDRTKQPVTDNSTFPVLSHTQYLNLSPADQLQMATDLDLVTEEDNPMLTSHEQAQVWWVRAHEQMKGNYLISKVVAATKSPTSTVAQKAPTK